MRWRCGPAPTSCSTAALLPDVGAGLEGQGPECGEAAQRGGWQGTGLHTGTVGMLGWGILVAPCPKACGRPRPHGHPLLHASTSSHLRGLGRGPGCWRRQRRAGEWGMILEHDESLDYLGGRVAGLHPAPPARVQVSAPGVVEGRPSMHVVDCLATCPSWGPPPDMPALPTGLRATGLVTVAPGAPSPWSQVRHLMAAPHNPPTATCPSGGRAGVTPGLATDCETPKTQRLVPASLHPSRHPPSLAVSASAVGPPMLAPTRGAAPMRMRRGNAHVQRGGRHRSLARRRIVAVLTPARLSQQTAGAHGVEEFIRCVTKAWDAPPPGLRGRLAGAMMTWHVAAWTKIGGPIPNPTRPAPLPGCRPTTQPPAHSSTAPGSRGTRSSRARRS